MKMSFHPHHIGEWVITPLNEQAVTLLRTTAVIKLQPLDLAIRTRKAMVVEPFPIPTSDSAHLFGVMSAESMLSREGHPIQTVLCTRGVMGGGN